jgi:hypothetical protein
VGINGDMIWIAVENRLMMRTKHDSRAVERFPIKWIHLMDQKERPQKSEPFIQENR